MSLTVSARHRLGAFSIDARFASDGGVTALFGRSGSGKTTLVNIIAGLIAPDEARIALGGETVVDTTRHIATPVHRRRFGYVFQEARLFPHLSVRRNLVYGQWFSLGFSRAPKTGFERIVDMLDVGHLLDRPAAHLSGGEKQRIAIGRALLSRPRLLLMDEPLASLDDARKAEILPYLERLRDEMAIPIVYVSHSVTEVARLANHVVLIEAGRVIASGHAAAVLNQPSPAVGRREAGTLVEGTVEADAARITVIRAGALRIRVPDLHLAPGTPIRLQIAARDVMLSTQKPEGLSALNIFGGTVTAIGAEIGGMVDITVDCSGLMLVARITALSCDLLGLEPGKSAHAIVKSVALDR